MIKARKVKALLRNRYFWLVVIPLQLLAVSSIYSIYILYNQTTDYQVRFSLWNFIHAPFQLFFVLGVMPDYLSSQATLLSCSSTLYKTISWIGFTWCCVFYGGCGWFISHYSVRMRLPTFLFVLLLIDTGLILGIVNDQSLLCISFEPSV